ncbi:polysaccharide deacetylase family protein [Winogradskyella echinorum]|uniref:Polysaccharide deacetylase family protein n=1 Tax=Winogradskyella echinorum TaxID=538189 RepID=A0ABR6Y0M7_9FLAO|nr:polysaccharide deacetylase family protein [Winogradskyella echinorum]MBC3846209.1 polysaccharide deacetylase family protein [Winogradskyella echinorum]MBC5750557.1 polysaccharide deacetylase family protein [Winogradskyella echinorum]
MSLLMFHSIGCEKEDWYRRWLSVSLDHFENFCKYLVKHNYETVSLDQWFDSKKNTSAKKQVVITFDDGYLDNWVYAYPILKKYNLKGTIFVNPEFIDGSLEARYNLEDVWNNKIERNKLTPLGFVNWSELKIMDASGVMDIQSHSMSHNFYYQSNTIKDIYEGQPNYDWMAWIEKPNRKPYYNTEKQDHFTPKGTPIFDFGRALALRRYFPDEELLKYAEELYSNNNGDIDKTSIIKQLNDKLSLYPGTYESDEDMEKRYRYEIFESKRILEEKLNKTVDYFCWPGGGYNQLSIDLCIEAGYKASTASFKNKPYAEEYKDYKKIKRVSMTSFISTPKDNYYAKRSNFLVNLFKSHEGKIINKNIYRAEKLWLMILEKLRK